MKQDKKVKVPRKKTSDKAGIIFPVSRFGKMLRQGNFAPNVSVNAAICIAASLEYLVREVLEIAIDVTKKSQTKTITPRIIQEAMTIDEDLSKFVNQHNILAGGQPKAKRAKTQNEPSTQVSHQPTQKGMRK
jgi:histone H2A